MRNPARIERILRKLEEYWKLYPDMRLCQIMCNAARMQGWSTTNIYHVEDELIDDWLKQRIEGLP